MNRTPLIRSAFLAAALVALTLPVVGQNALEIISLRHRTADQVLPALRPLLEPGATLTGQGSQLIVRTSPQNLADLRRALDVIDRPARRLQISVRFDQALDSVTQGVEASGRISNRGARVDVRAQDDRTSASDRVDQRIQVLEGGRAFIFSGQSNDLRETATGFEAIPRLAGDRVTVDIAPQRQSAHQYQAMATTVSARLGEWFEVGGAVEDNRSPGSRRVESRRVWLKVDEIRP